MDLKDLMNALRKAIDSKTKAEHAELVFEYLDNSNHSDKHADLTSVVLPKTNGDTNDSELSFFRFLGSDFTGKPVVLISQVRRGSVSEDNEKQSESTPPSIKSNGVGCLSSSFRRMDYRKDASDVWGSPLKCGIPMEDESLSSLSLDTSQIPTETKRPRVKRLGIALNLARKILSGYSTTVSSSITHPPPVLALCNGVDRHTTALLGVKPFQECGEAQTTTGFKMVTVTVDEKGADVSNKTVKMGGGLSQTCQAVYQVNEDSQKPWATVAMEIKWKGANRLLESPPLDSSTAIKASVQSGNIRGCVTLYQELQFLERMVSGLTTGQVEWMPPASDKATVPLTVAVKALIDTLAQEGTLHALSAAGEGEAEMWSFTTTAVKLLAIPERKDYDFTDRLWKVMQDCTSTHDLISSLRMVFKALGQGHLRPFVDRHNHTTMAQIVRESFTSRFSAPSLTGDQPLLFVAEMGAEKLRRDYIQVFVSQSLATPSCLEAFTGPDQELADKVEQLLKLHSVVEMMALLGATLRLPGDTLGGVARHMLSHYRLHPLDPHHVFTFPVKTCHVRHVLGSVPPVLWCVETGGAVSATDSLGERSLHCLSLAQPLTHLQATNNNVAPPSHGASRGEESQGGVVLSPVGDGSSDYCLVCRRETVVRIHR
ncbi:protein zwilch homolog [Babylonia areolata]|uniref:protein zwilch homolog n=1 Tax=Babylonia areolata TaxID=304850 RepID=UPI003FD44279